MTKKIAIIASSLHPERQKHLIDWYLDLKKEYPNCQLFLGSKNSKIPFAKNYKVNSKLEGLKYLFKNLIRFKIVSNNLKKIQPLFEYNPDVIHLLTSNAFEKIEPLIKHKNIPLIVSFRGYDINVLPFQRKENKFQLQRIFEKTNKLHFISNALKSTAIKLGAPSNKCLVIRRSIDTSFGIFSKKENKKPVILSVGRLVWEKGYFFSLKTMAILKENNIDFEYRIIGEGVDRNFLEFQIKYLGLSDNIKILGELSQDDVVVNLKEADVFLQTSVSEALSRALIEASLYGLPIVASNCGGIPEVVENGKSGFLHPICSPEKYATSLQLLIENLELRRGMGEAARAKIMKEFSRENEIKKWIEIYRVVFYS